MRVAVVTFPGSNCDHDLVHALEAVGAEVELRWHRDPGLDEIDAVFLSGGFSYGDYLRAGAIARFSPVMHDVVAFARRGGIVAGICNGFQILCEAGLLPGALIRNESLRFQSQDCRMKVERTDTAFTNAYPAGAIIRVPLAHAEGNYRADEETLARLEGEGRVLFRYVDAEGEATPEANPNGSTANIAGILDARGTVMGMMPHPERAMESILGSTDGVGLFESIMAGVAGAER
ncbi:MAG: phosphoribosylformylglycinamidine synthase subunit PurQ [Longimicrobiales bacterium]|nr:phosphoribosylformylglycinamidine synthase subunit PurQ [Longimicrobiales bacterium]